VSEPARVSVALPSYNYGRYLASAIESVLGQSHAELELLIVDNGSSDDSFEIARSYELDPRVHVSTHPGHANLGPVASLNKALEEASGMYFCWIAADDVYLQHALARSVEALSTHPESAFVYGRYTTIDASGTTILAARGVSPTDRRHLGTSDPLQALVAGDVFVRPYSLIRTDAVRRVGGFEQQFFAADWQLFVKLLAHSHATFIDDPPLFAYRIHSENLSGVAQTPAMHLIHRDAYAALRDRCEAIGGRCLEPRIRALVSLQHAFFAWLTGKTVDAREAVESAYELDISIGHDPAWLLWWLRPRYAVTVPADPNASAEGHESPIFGRWFVSFAKTRLPVRTTDSLRWAVGALEVESRGAWRPQFELLVQCLISVVVRPQLLANRWFVRALLTGTGTLPVARRLRSLRG
jgi:glycosyltransferase involved in cell wall biosynthesis